VKAEMGVTPFFDVVCHVLTFFNRSHRVLFKVSIFPSLYLPS